MKKDRSPLVHMTGASSGIAGNRQAASRARLSGLRRRPRTYKDRSAQRVERLLFRSQGRFASSKRAGTEPHTQA